MQLFENVDIQPEMRATGDFKLEHTLIFQYDISNILIAIMVESARIGLDNYECEIII